MGEWVSVDQRQQRIIAAEAVISEMRAVQIEELDALDEAQVATGDGFRSLSDWTTAVLDIAPETAKRLVRTLRRTVDRPDLRTALASGEASFDRVEALSRIPENVGLLEHIDVAAVHREAAKRARITSEDEYRSADDRFLILQPSLDESWWKLWGGLDGVSGAIVDKVLTEAADQLPLLPDGTRGDSSWRRATALVQTCISDDPSPAEITVFIDSQYAVPSGSEAGVVLEAGPRIGRQALEALLCESVTEVIVNSDDGTPMNYGRRSRNIPPSLRRATIHRDGNRCVADGCQSRNRLQIHHLQPWSEGGSTDAENLITLCWFHHQVVVHQRGFTVYRVPKHGRIRFRQAIPRGPPD
ncbi:MAG TPA: HNH endonuclease [Acidimicrobiia bacterium]|nr:HNH endonuclease [Acidimicrobiia bacterium]